MNRICHFEELFIFDPKLQVKNFKIVCTTLYLTNNNLSDMLTMCNQLFCWILGKFSEIYTVNFPSSSNYATCIYTMPLIIQPIRIEESHCMLIDLAWSILDTQSCNKRER